MMTFTQLIKDDVQIERIERLLKHSGFVDSDTLKNMTRNRKDRFRAYQTLRQGFKCYYCQCKLTLEKPVESTIQSNYATFEHIVDFFQGCGEKKETLDSIKVACQPCNAGRGHLKEKRAISHYSQFFEDEADVHRILKSHGWKHLFKKYGTFKID